MLLLEWAVFKLTCNKIHTKNTLNAQNYIYKAPDCDFCKGIAINGLCVVRGDVAGGFRPIFLFETW